MAARSQPRGGGYGIGGAFGTRRGGSGPRDAAAVVGGVVGGSLRLLWSAGSAALRAAAKPGAGAGGRRRAAAPLGRQARAWVARQRVTAQWKLKEALGLNAPRQRYFPQCRPCSQLQAVAVRTGKRTLKTHAGGSKPWFYSVRLGGGRGGGGGETESLDGTIGKTHSFFLSLLSSLFASFRISLFLKINRSQQGTIVGLRHYQEPGLKGGSGGPGGGSAGRSGSRGVPGPDADVLEDLARSVRKAAGAANAAMGGSATFGGR